MRKPIELLATAWQLFAQALRESKWSNVSILHIKTLRPNKGWITHPKSQNSGSGKIYA